jgi:hypothetical protein
MARLKWEFRGIIKRKQADFYGYARAKEVHHVYQDAVECCAVCFQFWIGFVPCSYHA